MGSNEGLAVIAPKQLLLPYLSGEAVAATVPKDGDIGLSGGQIIYFTDGVWHTCAVN